MLAFSNHESEPGTPDVWIDARYVTAVVQEKVKERLVARICLADGSRFSVRDDDCSALKRIRDEKFALRGIP